MKAKPLEWRGRLPFAEAPHGRYYAERSRGRNIFLYRANPVRTSFGPMEPAPVVVKAWAERHVRPKAACEAHHQAAFAEFVKRWGQQETAPCH